jgi:hypothetical protein
MGNKLKIRYLLIISFLLTFMAKQSILAQNSKFVELSNYFLQDGQTIAWLQFSEEQLAHLNKEELVQLRNHIYARQGYIFTEKKWQDYFQRFDWYEARNTQIELTKIDENNLALIQAFENASQILAMPNSGFDFSATLNGCWQITSMQLRATYPDRFVFYAQDKSFAFLANQLETTAKNKLNYSGRFSFPAKNQIELEIITKDILTRTQGKPYKDPVSGKVYHPRVNLKIKTIHLDKSEGFEYKTLSISDVSFVNIQGKVKVFMKLDGNLYWQISRDPENCK